MKDRDIRERVLEQLLKIAPDIDPLTLDESKSFRDQYDFDSIDYMNLMMALGRELNVEIPEVVYPSLSSLDGAVAWLAEHVE